MSLKNKIDQDIKQAMLAKNQDELRALRAIKSMILLAETEKGAGGELSDDAENKLLMKAAKQRKESADLYREQNRDDLLAKEEQELTVIERYLPQQLSEEEVQAKVAAIIEEQGATSMADMGRVMGIATKTLAGQADGKLISELVRKTLS